MAKFEVEIPFGRISAETYSQFLADTRFERDFWTGIGNFDYSVFPSTQVQNHSRSHIQTVNALISRWQGIVDRIEQIDGRTFPEEFENLATTIRSHLGVPPHSTSNLAQSVKLHTQQGNEQAAAALLIGYLLQSGEIKPQQFSNHIELGAYLGFVQGSYAATLAAPAVGANARYNQFEKDFALVQKSSAESAAIEDRLRFLEDSLTNEIDLKRKAVTEELVSIHTRILRSYKAAISLNKQAEQKRLEEFGGLLEAFNLHMRLKRPVALWEERENEHSKKSQDAWDKFRVATFALAFAAILVALVLGDHIARTFVPQGCVIGTETICSSVSPKGPLTIAMIFLVATVWLWFLRLQMKIHLSERHLALDARERRAFAETYLSLLKGNQVSSQHESVILESLFRPTQDGIIKDEGGLDLSAAGVLSRALDRRS